MAVPGAYRLGDGAPVTFEAARAIWSPVAREVLAETSRAAAAFIAESELAKQVQQRSGIYTRAAASEWLPVVLAEVEPDLATLCRPDASLRRQAAPRAPRARPAAEARPRKQERPTAICPTCFMALPASGRCDTCG